MYAIKDPNITDRRIDKSDISIICEFSCDPSKVSKINETLELISILLIKLIIFPGENIVKNE